MKRELKKAISTIRKIQDAVFNNAVSRDCSISVNCSQNINGLKWWTIYAHNNMDCRHWIFDESDIEQIDKIVSEIEEYIK